MSNSDNKASNERNKHSFFNPIKAYAEIITAIALIVGGVSWVFEYFATKQQLKDLQSKTLEKIDLEHCLIIANIEKLSGERDKANLEDRWRENIEKTNALKDALKNMKTLNAKEKNDKSKEQITLEVGAESIKMQITRANDKIADAVNKLNSGGCNAR